MANGTQTVQPGDLITATHWNNLVDNLNDALARIAALEAGSGIGGAVVIAGFNPANQQAAGQLLEISGANFAFPPADNTVTFGGEPVTTFLDGSSSSLIRVIVPTTVSAPPGGVNLPVRVSNTQGSAEVLYRVLPEIPVIGNPPALDSQTPFENVNGDPPPVAMGAFLVINGSDFAANPIDNQITFRVTVGSITTSYPPTGGPLEIDAANSSDSAVRVRVPDIAEIPGQFNAQPVVVELTVGAHPPVTDTVTIWRLP